MATRDWIFTGRDKGHFRYFDWGGDGPLLHIAHATGLGAGVYSTLAERLARRLHAVGLDFRGHGRTEAPADPPKLNRWAVFYDDLEAFLEHLGAPVVALGHSLGGTASLVVAARRPDLVTALILIEPGIMPPFWRPWVYLVQKSGLSRYVPFVTRASKRKSTWPDKQAAREDLRGKGPFRKWGDEFLDAYVEECMEETEQGSVKLSCDPAWEGRCLATAPVDIWRFVPRVRMPTLLLYGAQSTTFLPAVVKRFRAQVPHAIIKEFEQTGHFVPMERPDLSADAILQFLHDNKILS
ncbi:MAG: alpha/beta hydrolase [Desulfomonile tiedjei]|nr:alpha/beta hydrolase [Desulfomonile tiedjei]